MFRSPRSISDATPTALAGARRQGREWDAFLLKNSAMAFAKRMSRPAGCATIFLYERFELDLKNQGNPFLPYLRGIKRRMAFLSRRITKLTAVARAPSDTI